jgi:hypothetical protein
MFVMRHASCIVGRRWASVGILLLAVPLRGHAAELVTVTVGAESVGNIHPLNVPFVKEQAARVDAIQSRLDVLKEKQVTLPRRIEQLNARVTAFAETRGAANDTELVDLRKELVRLQGLLTQARKTRAEQKPERFTSYAQVLAFDRAGVEAGALEHQVRQVENKIKKRMRMLAAREPQGAKVVEETWSTEIELAMVNRDRGNVQAMRDTIKREVAGLLQQVREPGPPGEGKPNVQVAVPPVADAAQRMERFESRNAPEEVKALGERFFGQIDLAFPGLEDVATFVRHKNYQAALDGYKRFFFRTQARVIEDEDASALREEDTDEGDADLGGEEGFAWQKMTGSPRVQPPNPKAIEAAMQGDIRAHLKIADRTMGSVGARLGPPGAINWAFAAHAPKDTPPVLRAAYEGLAHTSDTAGRLGAPLLDSYVLTGNRAHLERWVEYTDDWSMNWSRDIDAAGLVRNYNMLIGYSHNELVRRLRDAAALNPQFVEDLPATTLARVLLAANAEYLTSAIRLMRSGQYNFRIMMLTGMMPHVLELQEFHAVRWTAREATRLAETSMTHNIRRDGANATLANAGHENTDGSFLGLIHVMERHKPDWLSPWWSDEFTLNLATYTRYWIHLMKQDGRAYRISTSPLAGHYGPGGSIKVQLLRDEAETQARLWKVYRQALPYDDPTVAVRLWTAALKGEPTPEPTIRAESMAFSGYSFLRTGWNESDYFLYFHFLNRPVASGRDDHNGFMLMGDGQGHLQAPPVMVDNRIQYIGHGLPPWSGAKGTFSVPASPDAVNAMRFHTSKTFDFVEGLYAGPYVYNPSHRKAAFCDIFGSYGMDLTTQRMRSRAEKAGQPLDETPITDVRHGRQVIALQGRKVWIATDFIDTPKKHLIQQNYSIPTPVPNGGIPPDSRLALMEKDGIEAVAIERGKQVVHVRKPGVGGMDMYHFSSTPVSYAVAEPKVIKLKKQADTGTLPLNRVVTASWTSDGPSMVTTLITPFGAYDDAGTVPVFKKLQKLQGKPGINGFTGVFADGTPVSYAASHEPARLGTDDMSVKARVFLKVGAKGIVLDCSEVSIGATSMPAPSSDFEFTVTADAATPLVATPILRPIKPVTILPETTVFTGAQEVALACETLDVDIRYTVDGSEPKHDSTLYTEPFTIRETTWVKARAFRKGMSSTPWVEDGTHATVQSWAVFEKKDREPATGIGTTRPGMRFEYVEDLWPYLLSEGLTKPAKKTGVVPTVLDVSPKETKGPYAVRYEGYLDVPVDGVYTFHAPSEFIFNDSESGYDLRVFVNGREWYPTTRWHAHGTWSVSLAKGKHAFKVFFVDMRRTPHRIEMQWNFPLKDFTWQGNSPKLLLSGPGMGPRPIPADMLSSP